MRIFKMRIFYVVILVIVVIGVGAALLLGDSPSSQQSGPASGSSQANDDNLDETRIDTSSKTVSFTYQLIEVTKAMLDSGQVPACCNAYYPPGSQALIITASNPKGGSKVYWFNVKDSGGGRNTFDFVPLSGGDRIIGPTSPPSINQAKVSWTSMQLSSSGGSAQIKVKDVQVAIDFMQNSFSLIPSSGGEF